jgi:hypothetical protein
MATQNVPLQIQRFWTDYVPERDHLEDGKLVKGDAAKLVPVDKVAYGPLGRIDNALVNATVSSILRVKPFVDANDPASVMSHIRADFIGKAYDAWKTGQEAPINGTPLAAWNGLTPEQAEIFRARSIRTVEEIASLNEATRAHIPLPNLSSIVSAAKRFVDSADQTRFAAALADKEKQIDELRVGNVDRDEQINALIAKVNQLAELVTATQAPVSEDEQPQRRKPGRPSNAELAARQTAQESEAA